MNETLANAGWLLYDYQCRLDNAAKHTAEGGFWARPEQVSNTAFYTAMAGIAAVAALITIRGGV